MNEETGSPVWAVIASHNRREATLRCLRSLAAQRAEGWTMAQVVLVDDGSSDGTAEAIADEFPQVVVHRNPAGDLYWARAMAVGAQLAIERGADALWMVNDDVEFDPDALARTVQT
ncbi:MAG: glycosyltransferase, partial [Acidimicrobiia bacterium]|nr:glycosyltransferase [Acidimicrobiia bacterium]